MHIFKIRFRSILHNTVVCMRTVCMYVHWYSKGSCTLGGATTTEKLRGTNGWVTTPGSLYPAPGHKPTWGWVRDGVATSRYGGLGYHPQKIFENSDAKSCILVTTTLISGLHRTCISEQTTSMSKAKSVPKF